MRTEMGSQLYRGTVLHDPARGDHQHAREVPRILHVVGDAKQCGLSPQLTDPLQERPPLAPFQTAEGLIQDDQTRARSQHAAAQAHPLPFTARDQPAALTEVGLETVRQALQEIVEPEIIQHLRKRQAIPVARAVAQVAQQRAIPELDRRIDPHRLCSQPIESLGI